MFVVELLYGYRPILLALQGLKLILFHLHLQSRAPYFEFLAVQKDFIHLVFGQLFLRFLSHGYGFTLLKLVLEEFDDLRQVQVFVLDLGVLVTKLDDHCL